MGIVKDFMKFVMRGNVMDLAVGVIIGGAFGKIVSSLVTDVITPPLGLVTGGTAFKDWVIPLGTKTADGKEAGINIGSFLQNVIDFLIVAAAIFVMIKLINTAQEFWAKRFAAASDEEKDKAAPPTEETLVLREIRDLLKERGNG